MTASVTDLGDLELNFGEGLHGDATLELKAADPAGLFDVGELQIHVNVPPAPTTPAGVPIEVSDCEYGTVLSIYDFFEDAEEADAALEYAITNITNFDIFDEVSLDPETGEIALSYAAGVGGTSEITLRAWDSYGAMGTNYFFVTTLCGDPVPVTATILEVEFVPYNFFDHTNISTENAARYGVLESASNPDGDVTGGDPENIQRGAWIQPGFMGGDRLFPDAVAASSTVGRNLVRVRATVEGLNVGDAVWFRSFDVDDPADLGYDAKYRADIDPNNNGNDNRGRMSSVHEPANSAAPDRSGRTLAGSGQLRTVGESNAFGAWGDAGKAVKGIVKARTNAAGEMIDDEGNVVEDAADAVKIAEVDLATTYAPGDNFRVGAVIQGVGKTDAFMESTLNKVDTHKITSNGDAPLIPASVKLTPQLAIWRTLWIEDDATTDIRALMTTVTTNRQQNRFADAFLETAYLLDATPLAATPVTLNFRTGQVSQEGDDAIFAARDSKGTLESPVFWVVYVGDTFTRVNDIAVPGFTVNNTSKVTNSAQNNAYEASIIFRANLPGHFPGQTAAQLVIAEQKIAVHEVVHQIMRNAVHRGGPADIVKYRTATAEQKADASRWRERINIMNAEAAAVVMDDAAEGPNDLFYLHAADIAAIRRRTNSPGKTD